MKDYELIDFQKKALSYGKYKGFNKEESEDFSIYATIRTITARNPILKFLFIDYFRERTHWARRKNPLTQQQARIDYYTYRYDEHTNGGQPKTFPGPDIIPFDKNKYDISIFQSYNYYKYIPQEYLEGLDLEEKKHIILYFVDGWTNAEIGKCFGLSESRISQKWKLLKEKMKRNIIKKKLITLEMRICACGCGREFRCYPNSPQKYYSKECEILKPTNKRSELMEKKLSKIVPLKKREEILKAADKLRKEGYGWGHKLEKKIFEMGYKRPDGKMICFASIYAWANLKKKLEKKNLKPIEKNPSASKKENRNTIITVREQTNEIDFIKFVTTSKLSENKKIAIIKILVN